MQNKNVPSGYIILALLLLISLAVNGFQYLDNEKLKGVSFSLLPGESIPGLDLITLKNEPFDESVFKEDKVVLFYIFETPCAKCNQNLQPWRNLTHYFGDKIQVVGVIPDGDPDAFKLFSDERVNFKLYYPGDIPSFRRKLRLKLKYAQTIIVTNGKVRDIKIGNLTSNDFGSLIETVNNIIEAY